MNNFGASAWFQFTNPVLTVLIKQGNLKRPELKQQDSIDLKNQ